MGLTNKNKCNVYYLFPNRIYLRNCASPKVQQVFAILNRNFEKRQTHTVNKYVLLLFIWWWTHPSLEGILSFIYTISHSNELCSYKVETFKVSLFIIRLYVVNRCCHIKIFLLKISNYQYYSYALYVSKLEFIFTVFILKSLPNSLRISKCTNLKLKFE